VTEFVVTYKETKWRSIGIQKERTRTVDQQENMGAGKTSRRQETTKE